MTDLLALVGPVEVAKLLAVKQHTVYQWRARKVIPAAEWTISGTPVWRRETIERWAQETDRLDSLQPR